MNGHIRELGEGRWQVMYDIDPDPVTGKRRQKSKVVHGTRSDAETVRDRIVLEVEEGRHAAGGRVTVAGFYRQWIAALEAAPTPSQGTVDFYRWKLEPHVIPEIGRRALTSIRGAELTALYGRLIDKDLSERTVLHIHRSVHRMYRDAMRWGYVTINPAALADPPTPRKYRFTTWKADEVTQFLKALPDDRWRTGRILSISTAMRRGEMLGIRWADLDGAKLHVTQTVDALGNIHPKPKTAAGQRVVMLDHFTVDVLTAHKDRIAADREFFGTDYLDHDLVTCWDDGRPVSGRLWSIWFQKIRNQTGLKYVRLHDLRHTWATLALESGIPAKVVSDRLGHTTIAITLDTYTNVSDQLQEEAAQKVAALMGL